jgi:hypothetical protein
MLTFLQLYIFTEITNRSVFTLMVSVIEHNMNFKRGLTRCALYILCYFCTNVNEAMSSPDVWLTISTKSLLPFSGNGNNSIYCSTIQPMLHVHTIIYESLDMIGVYCGISTIPSFEVLGSFLHCSRPYTSNWR